MWPLWRIKLNENFLSAVMQPAGLSNCTNRRAGFALATHRQSLALDKEDFQALLSVPQLAQMAGMSVSSFHAHFKNITGLSPLQYQKSLRLMAARTLMLAEQQDAATTAYQVGYESPSQFSREYARMFGSPPGRDVEQLRQVKKNVGDVIGADFYLLCGNPVVRCASD